MGFLYMQNAFYVLIGTLCIAVTAGIVCTLFLCVVGCVRVIRQGKKDG